MADYSQLKTDIAEVIRTNGNEEITGEVLQYILIQMVNSLGKGYQFAGVATPQMEVPQPDEDVVWLLRSGAYENFGTPFEVAENEFAVMMYNGAFELRKIAVGRPVDSELTEDGINPVEGKAIFAKFEEIEDAIAAALGLVADLYLEATPNVILTDTAVAISIMGSSQVEATSLTITRGGSQVANGTGDSISAIDNVNISEAGTITYLLTAVIGGVTRTKQFVVDVKDAVYYGGGTSDTDIVVAAPARKTPVGRYTYTISSGDKLFLLCPAGMTIQGMRMNNVDIPMEAATGIIRDGKSYLCYQSSNMYDAGTYIIDIY